MRRALFCCLVVWLFCASLAFGQLLLPGFLSPHYVLALALLVSPAVLVAPVLVRLQRKPLARSVIRGATLGVVAQFVPWLAAAFFALAAARLRVSWAEGLAYVSVYSFMLIWELRWLVPVVGLVAGGVCGGLLAGSNK